MALKIKKVREGDRSVCVIVSLCECVFGGVFGGGVHEGVGAEGE